MGNRMQNLKAKFKRWLALKTEECKDISPLFSYSYDRKLSFIENLRVKVHLYTCGACTNYVANLKFMHEVFEAQEHHIEENPHFSLSPDAADRIKEKLKSSIR